MTRKRQSAVDRTDPSLDADEEHAPVDERERRKADEEEELNVGVTYEVIRRAGRDELRRPSSALAWSGLAAGLSMGFSMMTESFLHARLPDATWTPLVSKFGYSIGFLMVILGNQQLYTENTLTAVIPLLASRSRVALRNTLRMWSVVLTSNLVGALLFAAVLSMDGLFAPAITASFDDVARSALHDTFLTTLILAIFAGWLIALMVWMLPAAKELSALVIIIITWVVGIAGFPHIIAGAIEYFYAGFQGHAEWSRIVLYNLLPALIGNTIGGVALVAGLAHAQVVAGSRRTRVGH